MKEYNLNSEINLNVKLRWKVIEHRYASDTNQLCIGKLPIASYGYDGTRSKGDPKCYKTISLISDEILGNFETEKECKEICYKVANIALNMLEYKE